VAAELVSSYIGAPRGGFTDRLALNKLDTDLVPNIREAIKRGDVLGSFAATLSEAMDTIDSERDAHLIRRVLLLSRTRVVSL